MRTRLSFLFLFISASTLWIKSEQTKIFKKTGDEVVLKVPAWVNSAITSILWKHNENLAVEWNGEETEPYLLFKERSLLNTSTGELTIKKLTRELSGVYTVEINKMILPESVTLQVHAPVPKPHIALSWNEERTRCTLTCEGSAMEPKPACKWKFNGTEQVTPNCDLVLTPETSAGEFVCELENPVSRESSPPVKDPCKTAEAGGLKVNTGLVVFACLLGAVVVVVLVHRVKSGEWFYKKDFWKKPVSHASSEPLKSENADSAGGSSHNEDISRA